MGAAMIKDKTRIVRDLEQIVGRKAVIHEEDELRVYECDGTTFIKVLPDIVVLPTTLLSSTTAASRRRFGRRRNSARKS